MGIVIFTFNNGARLCLYLFTNNLTLFLIFFCCINKILIEKLLHTHQSSKCQIFFKLFSTNIWPPVDLLSLYQESLFLDFSPPSFTSSGFSPRSEGAFSPVFFSVFSSGGRRLLLNSEYV